MLNVCFCFSDSTGDYHRHPLAALVSVFEHTSEKVRAHIISDETLTPEKRLQFERIAGRYGQNVVFYEASDIGAGVLQNVHNCFGRGSLFRLFMPELIGPGLADGELVLYLDCDTICLMDIKSLFEAAPRGAILAGVTDRGLCEDARSVRYLQGLGLEPLNYVNSGVLLMDLRAMLRETPDFARAVLEAIAGKKYRYPDQDTINAYFASQKAGIALLPENSNFCIGFADRACLELRDYEGRILHYNKEKPWETLFPAAFHYWRMRALCFPADETFAAMQNLRGQEYQYLYAFLLRSPKLRRMLNRLFSLESRGLAATFIERIVPGRREPKRFRRK